MIKKPDNIDKVTKPKSTPSPFVLLCSLFWSWLCHTKASRVAWLHLTSGICVSDSFKNYNPLCKKESKKLQPVLYLILDLLLRISYWFLQNQIKNKMLQK